MILFFFLKKTQTQANLVVNKRFVAGLFGLVLLQHIDHVEEVIPHVMLLLAMIAEALAALLKLVALATADEALGVHVLADAVLFITKLTERVDNDTEHDVQANDVDDDEERQVEEKAKPRIMEPISFVRQASKT